MTDTLKRRWFQFSIREAAVLVLALGFALAWWQERQALQNEREKWEPLTSLADQYREWLGGSGGQVMTGFRFNVDGVLLDIKAVGEAPKPNEQNFF